MTVLEQNLGARKSRDLYVGHSMQEALSIALFNGLIQSQATGGTISFVRMYGDRQKEIATLVRDGGNYVLRTTDFSEPTQEEREAFIGTAYSYWLSQLSKEKGQPTRTPIVFRANIGDIVECALKDGSRVVGYVSTMEHGGVKLNPVNTLKANVLTGFFTRKYAYEDMHRGPFRLEDIAAYKRLIVTSEKPELHIGEPVEAEVILGVSRHPRHYVVGYISKVLPNESVELDSYDPTRESNKPPQERKSSIFSNLGEFTLKKLKSPISGAQEENKSDKNPI